MPAFAIYRHAKHKNAGTVAAAANHMTRAGETPNADPARAHLNRILIGGEDPAADVAALVPALDAVDEQGRKRRRSNSVIALEVLLTASPEWWAEATPEQQQDWLDRSTGWLVAEYGREAIAHLRLHADERTPHLTGFIVPLDPETGHLNARRWVGGARRCAQQQTDYAAAVEPLGLVRGVEGSTAEHERVQRHYGQIARPVAALTIEQPPRVLWDPEGWAAEQAQNIAQQAAPALARAQTAESDRTAKKAAEARAEKDRRKRERAETALEDQKALSARLRALPLPDVLDALGFRPDPREKGRWRAEGFNITVGEGAKASKWFDHAAGVGRGGAIDLTAHALGTDFKGALAWLADRFGPGAAAADLTARLRAQAVAQVREAQAEREPFTPPAPAPEHWPDVRRYLTEDRGLPGPYIDRLHELGDCYADARRNAVFTSRNPETRRITGAELKGTVPRPDGTRFTGMAPGSRKDGGGFRVGDVGAAVAVYLVESAIDAISLFRLRHLAGEKGHAVISTAGTRKTVPAFLATLGATVRRVCAFDNDAAGDKAAHGLRRTGWKRERPQGKDWNDDLRARRAAGEGRGAAAPTVQAAHPTAGRKPPEPLDEGPQGPGL